MDVKSTGRIAAMCLCCLLFSAPGVAQLEEEGEETAAEAAYSQKGADTCLACHDDAKSLAVFKTSHAVRSDSRTPFGHGQLQCESCHGPGGEHAKRVRRGQERPPVIKFGSGETTLISVQNDMCLDCHTADVGIGWHSGSHGTDEVACADCHVSHAALDPVRQTNTQPEVCFNCHQLEHSETLKAYSHPFFEGKMGCSACHSAHDSTAENQFVRQTLNETCYDCHAEKRGPYLWEHPPVSEDCALCHAPHGSNQPGMLITRAPLLCQSCHSQAGHPSIAYDANDLPSGMPSQFLLGQSCLNCHTKVHGSNHPSGSTLTR